MGYRARAGDGRRPAPADALARILEEASGRFARDRQLRRRLPGGGRLFVDRRVPFLAVHREHPADPDPGTALLAGSFASYLVVPARQMDAAVVTCEALLEAMHRFYGTGLILEIWSRPESGPDGRRLIRVLSPDARLLQRFAACLDGAPLVPGDETLPGEADAIARPRESVDPSPPGLPSLAPVAGGVEGAAFVAIELPPVHRSPDVGAFLPERMSCLRSGITARVEAAVHTWITAASPRRAPPHRHALARRHLGRTARAVASRLADVAAAFDLILDVSPINGAVLWSEFDAAGRTRMPRFVYRPLSFDPEALKRSLFAVPLEGIEDPVVAGLIREKQEELDLRISMLRLRGRPEFFLGSLQIFGKPDGPLRDLALEILEMVPPTGPVDEGDEGGWVDAQDFIAMAHAELEVYRGSRPDFPQEVQLRTDLTSGLLVSGKVLCVGVGLRVTARRARALIQHEIGTHVLTHYNGSRQPLKLLASGLAHYGALQEGLAVLAEYLVGGLTRDRCRILAARVLAVDALVEGADFVEAFRALEGLGLDARRAFHVVLRVYRGGGLTKDLQYLAGLRDLLIHLGSGGDPRTLLVGKIGLSHVPLVEQLLRRGSILKPAVEPRYLRDPAVQRRLEHCRGRTVLDLLEDASA